MSEGAANADTVRGLYTPIAPDYDELWAPLLREHGRRLLDRLALEDAERVLDLGCGVGKLLPDISDRASRAVVVGCDLVEAMIRVAPDRFPRVVMDCTRSTFADGVFDAVVSTFMLFHVPRPGSALEEARIAMRPGGRIAIAVWGTGESFPAMTAWDEAFDRLGVPPDPAADGPPDGRSLTDSPEKMTGLLENAGFVSVHSESAEWLQRWDLDRFLRWRRGMGTSRRRRALLVPAARGDAVRAAADAATRLDQDAFVHRDEVVSSWARTPS
jgi:SAM-dependent methyltransferase